MPFIAGCTHDVYVAYARADDRAGDADAGWVSMLLQDLEPRLTAALGAAGSLDVWFDRSDFPPSRELFVDMVEPRIAWSALVLAVLSPAFRTAAWRPDELRAFLTAAPDAPQRLFVVEPQPLDPPPPMPVGVRVYRLWRGDPGAPRRLSRDDVVYHRMLDELADAMVRQVRALRRSGLRAPARVLGAGAAAAADQDPVEALLHARALASVAPTAPSPAAATETDVVEVCAFAPTGVRAGSEILLQALLHGTGDQARAEALAREIDPTATRRGVTTLVTEIARDSRIDVVLDAPGLVVDEPRQLMVWRGAPRSCQFLVAIPEDAAGRRVNVRLRIMFDSVPVGALVFSLGIGPASADAHDAPTLRGDAAKRYRRAFLSYAAADRVEVVKRAQALRAVGIDFFQDILSLEPGERWERRLYAEIDCCDLFLLFWSYHASASEWVIREATYALERRGDAPDGAPDIRPVILGGPPAEPPAALRAIHFDDPLHYVIAGIESMARPTP